MTRSSAIVLIRARSSSLFLFLNRLTAHCLGMLLGAFELMTVSFWDILYSLVFHLK